MDLEKMENRVTMLIWDIDAAKAQKFRRLVHRVYPGTIRA
jgi:hypothetical protein